MVWSGWPERALLEGLDVLVEGIGVVCSGCREGDGAGGAESDDGVGVFHQFGQGPQAAKGEALDLAADEFGVFGGEALEFSSEVFVPEPAVKGPLADAGFAGGLAHVGCGGEDGESVDLARGKVGQLKVRPILSEFVPLGDAWRFVVWWVVWGSGHAASGPEWRVAFG